MANLNIKKVPEELVARLKEEAERQGRSLNKHVIHLLAGSAEQATRPTLVERIMEWRAGLGPDEMAGDREVFEGVRDPDDGGGRGPPW